MKTKFLLSFLLVFLFTTGYQTAAQSVFDLNLSFEIVDNGIPRGWRINAPPGCSISVDSTTSTSGKYSLLIESTERLGRNQGVSMSLPNNYDGRQIALFADIKTDVKEGGFAILSLTTHPLADRPLVIKSATQWERHRISLPMNPSKIEKIFIGGFLVGEGKAWFDNLDVTIDGKSLAEAKIFERAVLPAESDKEFDNGSDIIFPSLNEGLITNLELLGKLWGFLKYHHPQVGKGNYNWDYELFRILPVYLEVENNQERDQILLEWISKYGEIPKCTTCSEAPPDAYLKPDLSWAEKSNMNDGLKVKIGETYTNRHQGDHYYFEMSISGIPQFLNENPYSNMSYPDDGFRLLALFRYWSTINYFFPSKYLTDKNWDNVLKEYIPLFLLAQNRLEYECAVIQVIGEIKDTHAARLTGGNAIAELRGNRYAPFRAWFIEGKYVVTDYYNWGLKKKAGLEVGDVISHINGKTIASIVDSLKKYYPASNEAAMLRDISFDLLRSNSHTLNIHYDSSGSSLQKEIHLYPSDSLHMYDFHKIDSNEECYKLLDENIGYITLATIKDEDVPKIKESFTNTKGTIIDIRNYPSTSVYYTLAPFFAPTSTPFVKISVGNGNNPGEFTFRRSVNLGRSPRPYGGKLVVIVNEVTQSHAEYTAMAFRAGYRTTVLGSTTAGADGNVAKINLPGGLQTMFSSIGIYYPDGTQTQRIGIVPDIEVKRTIQGIKEGRDEFLEKAIEIINQSRDRVLFL
ncbi:MAG: peptidase S41 [Prevotellaceae bacterium]|jgi:C-terminal processing protease CtpA/Prc|nr:peptidase S41 [Prevotellaceae bacterium]